MKKLMMFALAALMVFGLTACSDDLDPVIFTPNPNSVLKVNNLGSEAIVLFAAKGLGGSRIGALLGGVPGLAQDFGVPNVVSADGMFVLNVVIYDDYLEYQGNPNAGEPRIASSVLVYVDSTPVTYSVSAGPVGDAGIQFNNQTPNYVEIRGTFLTSSPSVYSKPLTVIRPKETKRLYLAEGEYGFFPVMKVPRMSGINVIGMVERFLKIPEDTGFWPVYSGNIQLYNIPENLMQSAKQVCAFITCINNRGALRLAVGNAIFTTSLGRETAPSYPQNAEYVVSVPGADSAPVGDPAFSSILIKAQDIWGVEIAAMASAVDFKAGKMYTITIPAAANGNVITVAETGDYNPTVNGATEGSGEGLFAQ